MRSVEAVRAPRRRPARHLRVPAGRRAAGSRRTWLRIGRGSGPEIAALLPDVIATVNPRLRKPYNDLALPIKVMDYLSYGRPLVVTDCTEQAGIVRDADCGIVVDDSVEGLAAGLSELLTAGDAARERWSANARLAAERHSWTERATRIVEPARPAEPTGAPVTEPA